jgi:hypothetical protein
MDLFDLWKRVDFQHMGFMEKSPRVSEEGFHVEDVCVDEELSSEDMDYDMEEYTAYEEYEEVQCNGIGLYKKLRDYHKCVSRSDYDGHEFGVGSCSQI